MNETMIRWGEDTRCDVCLCDLPAGATGYTDDDGTLCCDCAAAEDTHPAPATGRDAAAMAAALRTEFADSRPF